MKPTHETPADLAGVRSSREEQLPQRRTTPSPSPPHEGRDVNDLDDLESSGGRFLGEPRGADPSTPSPPAGERAG
jgi:hypothetical protein